MSTKWEQFNNNPKYSTLCELFKEECKETWEVLFNEKN